MLFKIKSSFVLPFVLMLFACVLTAPLAAGQTPAEGASSADSNAATNAPAIDNAAIEENAAKEAAAKEAGKEAAARAEKRAALKAELEKSPLLVTSIVPYVEEEDKGMLGNPQRLGKAGMGDRISVVIAGLSRAVEYEVVDPTKLVLFIDGRVFAGVYPESVGWDSVIYKLDRTKDAIDSWNGLLGSPRLNSDKPVVVSVGYADQKPYGVAKGYEKANLNLIVYRKRWAVGSLILLIVMVLVFWKFGGKNMLRDSGPPKTEPGKRPYSLAKVQVAWWFFLVVGCFLLIYLITGEFTMTEQALVLIGIGTGTALGSAMIDNSKRSSADSELATLQPQEARLIEEISLLNDDTAALERAVAANPEPTDPKQQDALKTDKESLKDAKIELAEKKKKLEVVGAQIADAKEGLTKPTSEGFWNDLVTDASGPSFHRFQMIAWTVILGILFLAGVYKDLSMPEFSGTMLALMGISAGTYLGFKIPEKQNTETPEAAAAQAKVDAANAQVKVDAAATQAKLDAASAGGQITAGIVADPLVQPDVVDVVAPQAHAVEDEPVEDESVKDEPEK